jgi:ABC-2 type transport system permease protein
MRALVSDHVLRSDLMLQAFAFNIVLFAAASFAFVRLLERSRVHGKLMQSSE